MTPPDLLALFESTSRLYELSFKNSIPALGSGGLLVEAFAATEALHALGCRDVIVLSTNAHIELKTLIGQPATLHVSLADGSRTGFSGLVNCAGQLGSEGGFARYRIRLVPWLWLLGQRATCRVWQDESVASIVESVFAGYAPHAAWAWSEEAGPFLQGARCRGYRNQYRETDLDFVSRILADEGVSWRIENHAESPAGHRVVLFVDSTQSCAIPEDVTSAGALGGTGIRFHGARAREEQDSIYAIGAVRSLHTAIATTASYDYETKQVVAAGTLTRYALGGKRAPVLESYDYSGADAFVNTAEAERYTRLRMEALEASRERWQGRSTVRTLRPGTRFTLSQGFLSEEGAPAPEYVATRVASVGVNNLPRPAQESLAELFGPLPEVLQACLGEVGPSRWYADGCHIIEEDDRQLQLREAIGLAQALGYANCFEAIPFDIPWRAATRDRDGLPLYPPPTALGSQTAIVVGANGQISANGADEIHCDRQGRVRIRFHWQGHHDDAAATCWVRVAQRWAGGGFGSQFLPRIGQEVLIQFLDNDINRPVVVCALYNGQGEGGVIPTPGGDRGRQADLTVFESAHDHAASAQGNLAGGHSPVWHGAASDDQSHRNSAAQWGIRSKEFGGFGYNQLLFDDTDRQGRIQFKSTQYASSLTLGHHIHSADNYRGSFRGIGVELRTDAYGAIRGGQGLMISTFGIAHSAKSRTPAGDNAPGMAHLKQAVQLAASFSQVAQQHKTVAYSSHLGCTKANASTMDGHAAPLKAFLKAASGMVDDQRFDAGIGDAAGKNTQPGNGKMPHTTDPIIAIAAKAGLGIAAGQNVQFALGETATFMSGADSQFITGSAMRMHAGQAIGLLAGAVGPGNEGAGLQMIAAKDAIDIQAHAGSADIQARELVDVISANSYIDWAAAKSISLSTSGGANITISGGNVTVQCPGKLTVNAGKKSLAGPESLAYPMPQFPKSICVDCLKKALAKGLAFTRTA